MGFTPIFIFGAIMKQQVSRQPMLEKLEKAILPVVTALGYELWGCVLCGVDGRSVLRIYIDVPYQQSQQSELAIQKQAVSLDDCRKISHEIGAILDVENLVKGRYNLEVSSPGLDRTLFTERQYHRFIGSMINIRLLNGEIVAGEKRKNIKGRLYSIENAVVTLTIDNKENANIPLANIAKANIIPEF